MTEAQTQLDACQSTPEILGLEGAAARSYFDALQCFNRSGLPWEGRKKHPSPDPLNALLSLAYTLLLNEFAAVIEAHGLDPAIGFLHEIDGARPSLALDLLEPFRAPVADRFVWTVVNRQQITAQEVSHRDGQLGIFLEPDSQRAFFESYEKWMLTPVGRRSAEQPFTYRALIRREVESFAAYLKNGAAPWSPYSDAAVRAQPDASPDSL